MDEDCNAELRLESKLVKTFIIEIVPSEKPHGWDVRILEEFPETVIDWQLLCWTERMRDAQISFNFEISFYS